MGWWSRWFPGIDPVDPAQRVLPEPFEPFASFGGIPVADPGYELADRYTGRTLPGRMWRTQPNVRKVVDFVARQCASVPWHAFERVSDNDRRRVGGALGAFLKQPRGGLGAYRFWHSVYCDGLLFDRWAVVVEFDAAGTASMVQVPSELLRFKTDGWRRVTAIEAWGGEEYRPLPMDRTIFDHGFDTRGAGVSPMMTLRDVLAENTEAVQYRREVWANGARVPGYIHRPKDAPKWSDQGRARFVSEFRDSYGRSGEKAGGWPLMEDGMEIRSADAFKPVDTGDIEARRLSAVEVASAFHIAPELVGAQQGNYSNVEGYHKHLWRDSLGPYVQAVQDVVNVQLLGILGEGPDVYVEANVEAKLRGSFEEQVKIMSSSTGAPWMTRNETRARMNLPPLDGGDDLVVPLNVLVGGQASPRDAGTQNEQAVQPSSKAAPTRAENRKARQLLAGFFRRQRQAVLTALGAKAGDGWWDEERWNRELARDLLALGLATSTASARRTLAAHGRGEKYDPDLTVAYLTDQSATSAATINATTKRRLDEALAAEEDPRVVFDEAEQNRSKSVGTGLTTMLVAFGAIEAGKQSGAKSKTWITGSNPRPSHAARSGETVAIDTVFSSGRKWPSGPNCQCQVSIGYGE